MAGPILDDGHIRYVSVNLTDNCNLQCNYCFSRSLRHKSNMSRETAVDFAHWYGDQTKSGEYHVTFFGGEPFLQADLMPVIVQTLNKRAPIGVSFVFSATSNGTLVRDHHTDMLQQNKIHVMVSSDGDRKIHNLNRTGQNGRGSFDDFLHGVSVLQRAQKKVTARLTFTPETVKYLVQGHEALLTTYGLSSVAASPVSEANWDIQAITIYEQQLFELAGFFLEKASNNHFLDIRILQKGILDIMTSRDPDKSPYPCGAGRLTAGVGPDGTIYPCHRFVGEKTYTIGSISDGIDSAARRAFWDHSLKTGRQCRPDKGCSQCEIRTMCRGECFKVARETTGNIWEATESHYRIKEVTFRVAAHLTDYLLENDQQLLEKITGLQDGALLKAVENYSASCA